MLRPIHSSNPTVISRSLMRLSDSECDELCGPGSMQLVSSISITDSQIAEHCWLCSKEPQSGYKPTDLLDFTYLALSLQWL